MSVSRTDFERDLIADGHVLPGRSLPLSIGDGNTALISIEDRNRKPQAWAGLKASAAGTVCVVDRVKVHELLPGETYTFAGCLDRDFRCSQIGTHRESRAEQ